MHTFFTLKIIKQKFEEIIGIMETTLDQYNPVKMIIRNSGVRSGYRISRTLLDASALLRFKRPGTSRAPDRRKNKFGTRTS